MKKLGLIGVAVAALLLAGCSAPVVESAREAPSSAPSATTAKTPTSEPTAAAIEMEANETIDATTPWGEAGFESADAWYLASMDTVWQGERPSDDQLIGAGMLACEQIAAGATRDDVVVVTGDTEEAASNNRKVISYALFTYCP